MDAAVQCESLYKVQIGDYVEYYWEDSECPAGMGGGGGWSNAEEQPYPELPDGDPETPHGGGATAAPPKVPQAPAPRDWAVCKADLRQTGWALAGSAIGVGGYQFARGFTALARSGEAWTDIQLTTSFARNAALLPSLAAARVAAKSGGTPNPFVGMRAIAYSLMKSVPVFGAGLEFGEAINSCLGRTR